MGEQLVKISVICFLATVCLAHDLTSSAKTPLLIKKHGYPVEEHTVQTSDGYILTMHRIPYSYKLNNNASKRPVVFIMHGFLSASNIFVINGPKRSLPYILSDAGYDIWLGNARGNLYSRKHITLSPNSKLFWNFEWHQIAIYDIPAMVDFALKVTGEDQVRYIGHSQGTTTLLVLNALNPSINNRIRSAHLLSPVAFFNNTQSALFTVGEMLDSTELLPSSRGFELMATEVCKDGSVTQDICTKLWYLLWGADSPYLNKTTFPDTLSVFPSGSAFNQYQHYIQLFYSGKFRQYDYGQQRNLKIYGSIDPPDYNLKNINIPTYLYYSDNDYIVMMKDLNRLIVALEQTKILKRAYCVPYSKWNHMDFLFGIDVEKVLYNVVLNDIRNS